MSEHKVTLKWERGGVEFSYLKYPRDHTWSFDGGHTMKATAAPAYVGNPAYVDPEEAFVASLSSCHMLTFLAIGGPIQDRHHDGHGGLCRADHNPRDLRAAKWYSAADFSAASVPNFDQGMSK
jgi:hypothetical protein